MSMSPQYVSCIVFFSIQSKWIWHSQRGLIVPTIGSIDTTPRHLNLEYDLHFFWSSLSSKDCICTPLANQALLPSDSGFRTWQLHIVLPSLSFRPSIIWVFPMLLLCDRCGKQILGSPSLSTLGLEGNGWFHVQNKMLSCIKQIELLNFQLNDLIIPAHFDLNPSWKADSEIDDRARTFLRLDSSCEWKVKNRKESAKNTYPHPLICGVLKWKCLRKIAQTFVSSNAWLSRALLKGPHPFDQGISCHSDNLARPQKLLCVCHKFLQTNEQLCDASSFQPDEVKVVRWNSFPQKGLNGQHWSSWPVRINLWKVLEGFPTSSYHHVFQKELSGIFFQIISPFFFTGQSSSCLPPFFAYWGWPQAEINVVIMVVDCVFFTKTRDLEWWELRFPNHFNTK